MHCILFMFSCNFLVTVQENYKPLFSSCILGDTILCEYRFNFRSTQAYRLNLSINLSFCFKNNSGCDPMFPNTFNKGYHYTHTHTHTTMVNTSFVSVASSASIMVRSKHPLTTGTPSPNMFSGLCCVADLEISLSMSTAGC